MTGVNCIAGGELLLCYLWYQLAMPENALRVKFLLHFGAFSDELTFLLDFVLLCGADIYPICYR